MTSFLIEDFKLGLDVRRSFLTAQPGSLRVLDNCVVTAGGEIEKRKAFVPVYTLPAGTAGLYGTASTFTPNLYVYKLTAPGGTLTTLTSLGGFTPVKQLNLAPGAGDTSITYIFGTQQYGSDLFVTGSCNNNVNLRNWWQGVPVPQYLGLPPVVSEQKVYRGGGTVLYFSGIGDPSVTNPLNPLGTGPNTVNPGAGFIDLATITNDTPWIMALTMFYKQMAVFARWDTMLFSMDADPTLNNMNQSLKIGSVSYFAPREFGTGDVLFLADSGVRSLRALNASMTAAVNDIGSPIDKILQAAIPLAFATGQFAQSLIEPETGRFWLSMENTIYVLSHWPSSHIAAWSTFTLPFHIDWMVRAGNYIFIRSGDTIYQYGGLPANLYDNSVATVQTPHHAAETPTTWKTTHGIDVACSGTWNVSVGMQTDNPTLYETAATITGDTLSLQKIPFAGHGTHISFMLTSTDAGPASLGSISASYSKGEEK